MPGNTFFLTRDVLKKLRKERKMKKEFLSEPKNSKKIKLNFN